MKKHYTARISRLSVAAILTASLAISCSKSSKTESETDSDSIAVMEMVDAVTSSYHASLTKDSIGAIKIGMSVNDIPGSIPGLYEKKENGASPDAVTVTFSNADGEQFVAYDFGDGNVDVLNVIGKGVTVDSPSGAIAMGTPFTVVLALPGVKAEWSGYDDSGMWYWTWDGIWFAPSQERLSEHLSKILYHSDKEPVAEDFSEDVTVGFIGTGLPF